jgi:hypothetical protein
MAGLQSVYTANQSVFAKLMARPVFGGSKPFFQNSGYSVLDSALI